VVVAHVRSGSGRARLKNDQMDIRVLFRVHTRHGQDLDVDVDVMALCFLPVHRVGGVAVVVVVITASRAKSTSTSDRLQANQPGV
jgi:hypothetical protein